MTDPSHIRNFSIIAHIDHGKSTLSDRVLEMTGTVAHRDMQAQLLDSMDIERERGITIKSQAVRVNYTADDGETYQFNLIDTPGHVDFTYEVSRSLAACEGAVLVVDATQGVEAQTVANAMMAMNANLEIIPLINKIDLAQRRARTRARPRSRTALPSRPTTRCWQAARPVWASTTCLRPWSTTSPRRRATRMRPCARSSSTATSIRIAALWRSCAWWTAPCARARNSSSWPAARSSWPKRWARVIPPRSRCPSFGVGEVGYLVTGLKDLSQVKVGDTLTLAEGGVDEPLPGYREAKPMVYTGLFPIDADQYEPLKEALEKLSLNDPALIWEPEKSHALGFGFRVGFLGLLHMEVVKERLEREFDLDLLATAPSRGVSRVPARAAR